MTYQLVEIDLTRHVRTPAGVAYFHKPIGSPIGGKGSAAPSAKAALKTAFQERRAARSNPFGQGPGPAITGSTSQAEIEKLGKGRKAVYPKAKPVPATKMSKRARAQEAAAGAVGDREAMAAGVRRDLRPKSSSNDNLWQLDNKRLTAALADPNTPAERKRALKIEKAQRISMVQSLLKDKKEIMDNPEMKAAIKSGDSGRIGRVLHKHAPKAVSKAWDKFVGRPAKAIKDADHAQSFMDAFWDFVVKAAGGVIAVAIFGAVHGLL